VRFVGDPPDFSIDFGQSVRRQPGADVRQGDRMYRQFLDQVPPEQWLQGLREKHTQIYLRSAREGTDYRLIAGTRERWPLDGVGAPWTVHHEPPLYWVTAEGSHLWRPMPIAVHDAAHRWWTRLDRMVRRQITPELMRFLRTAEQQVDIREVADIEP
jgi:hypothetical protein